MPSWDTSQRFYFVEYKKSSDYTKNLKHGVKGLRVGVSQAFFGQGLNDKYAHRWKMPLRFKEMGAEIVE